MTVLPFFTVTETDVVTLVLLTVIDEPLRTLTVEVVTVLLSGETTVSVREYSFLSILHLT